MKITLSSVLLLPLVAVVDGAAWAPSSLLPHQPHHHLAFAPNPQKQQQSALHMATSGSTNATSSSSSTSESEGDPTATTSTTGADDVDPVTFQADLDKGLEALTNLVDDYNAPAPSKGFGTPPKGFGKKATPSKKKDDGQKFVDDASKAIDDLNRFNEGKAEKKAPTKSPHQLIREAKQAKAQKIQKITAEEASTTKKEIFNPVSQPWLKKEETKTEPKAYFPPTPIANKPMVPVKPKTPEKEEKPTVTASEKKVLVKAKKLEKKKTPVAQQTQKTYFPPTPMDKKPKVPVAKKQEEANTPVVGKTTNPFVQPPKKEKTPVVEEELKKEQAQMKLFSDKVSGSGVETTDSTTGKAEKQEQKKKNVSPQLPKIPKMEMPKMDLPKVELPKVDLKKVELPKMDLDLKKLEMPKLEVSKDTVDQAMDFTQKTSSILVNGAQVLLKGGMDWMVDVQASFNTTRVDDLDMTYEEAFGKVAQGGRGFFKICSILGSAVKDTVSFFANEIQQQRKSVSSNKKKKILSPAAKAALDVAEDEDEDSVVVDDWRKPKPESASSYLDQLESETLGSFMKKEEEQKKAAAERPRLNVRDIRVPTIPIFKAAPTPKKAKTEATKTEMAADIAAPVEDVTSDDTKKAAPSSTTGSSSPKIDIPQFKTTAAVEELGRIQSKAGSMLGDLWSSASKAMKDAQAKAKEEADKLQAKAGGFKLPKKTSKPRMSKTHAVVDPNKKKKKGGPSFFSDLDDK